MQKTIQLEVEDTTKENVLYLASLIGAFEHNGTEGEITTSGSKLIVQFNGRRLVTDLGVIVAAMIKEE